MASTKLYVKYTEYVVASQTLSKKFVKEELLQTRNTNGKMCVCIYGTLDNFTIFFTYKAIKCAIQYMPCSKITLRSTTQS